MPIRQTDPRSTSPTGPGAPVPASPVTGRLAEGGATVEEELFEQDEPQEILVRSGFTPVVDRFALELCSASDMDDARRIVERHGDALWRKAVNRVQEVGHVSGDLSAGDDRPLYWARLGMTSALNRWEPAFGIDAAERADLVAELERRSRGQSDPGFPETAGKPEAARVVVTGFDPFGLDKDIRRANPSGAAALALDGAVIETGGGVAVVRAMLFPVRWRDFTDGMVERALLPYYTGGRPAAAVITVSQGRDGLFDLEAHNGAWRGGSEDNEAVGPEEMIPVPGGFPTVTPQPQWSDSSLNRAAVVEETTRKPFPVVDNTEVAEIPAGGTTPVVRPDGPTPGSRARAGGGGDYLSNEIAYRNTLLRDATGRDIPAGHVHTPILHLGSECDITDPAFEKDRATIVDQVRNIVAAVVRTSGSTG